MDKYGMQETNNSSVGNQPRFDNTSVPTRKKPLYKHIFQFIKKYALIIVIVFIIAAAIFLWLAIRAHQKAVWTRATDYFSRAEYEKAEKELRDVKVPSKADQLRVYGQTMLATRNLDKSLAAYNKLYDLNKDPSDKLIIGNIYNEQKKYDEAIKVYREVIAANPNNIQAYVNAATVYKLQNNSNEAIKIANEGVEKNPSSVVLHELKVSMLMSDKNSKEYKDAIEALKKLNPQDQLLQALNEL